MSVCLSVCVFSHISETTRLHFTKFLRTLPVAVARSVRHVPYFRFCGRRRVFAQRVLWRVVCVPSTSGESVTAETAASNAAKFCSPPAHRGIAQWERGGGAKSVVYDCLVLPWTVTSRLALAPAAGVKTLNDVGLCATAVSSP